MPVNGHDKAYTCRCLNVCIRPQVAPDTSAQPAPTNAEYTQVYVGDEGISVVHPQLTLRTRSPGVPISGTTRCTRYTSLTCLICHTVVYRVYQVVPLDVEGKDGPQFPTDDWVEEEVMKSSTGWIEVHGGCLTGDAIIGAGSSTSYSTVFKVVLPSSPLPSPSLEQPRSSSPLPPLPPKFFLSDMRSLLPPAPFTPSHPVFLHLALVASHESQALRASAEEYFTHIVAEKTKEIERAEDQLRWHVEKLWKAFRGGIDKLEQGSSHSRLQVRQRDAEVGSTGSGGSLTRVVRDFVPPPNRPVRLSQALSLPRVSSLSASLATTSFHHPRAIQTSPSPPGTLHDGSPPSHLASSSLSDGRYPSSPSTVSSLTLHSQAEGTNILGQFKRNMNQSTDTAASFRYFTNIEAEMARVRGQEHATAEKTHITQNSPGGEGSHGHTKNPTSVSNGHNRPRRIRSPSHPRREGLVIGDGRLESESQGAPSGGGPLTNGSKGKRKVTFDIQPDVVTIKREVNAEKEEEAAAAGREAGEMIFDLEDEGSERSLSGLAPRPLLPLIESVHASGRAARSRVNRTVNNTTGLPESFSTLRPTSLPVPSHVRPPRDHDVDGLSQSMRAPQVAKNHAPQSETDVQEQPEILDPREAEILKLVAADAPSHRGAWKRDSKAWQLFVRRQDGRAGDASIIHEELESSGDPVFGSDRQEEDDGDTELDAQNGNHVLWSIVGSLPIGINPLSRPKPPLSLASYQPDAPISNRSELVSPRLSSTATLRKAAYAERDRTRSMDPGTLDFDFGAGTDDDDDDGESDGEIAKAATIDTGERGRKLALRILQARSSLPAPGMWRSLA